jgi:hypothetical protein
MTLVCVRFHESYSRPRLTALADSRATYRRKDGGRKILSEKTVKLFVVPVRCYLPSSLKPSGVWTDPYFETVVGLGFCGDCFEALTIEALVRQELGVCVAHDGRPLQPSKEGLVNLVGEITRDFFNDHSEPSDRIVRMILFGFDARRPWIGRVSWDGPKGLTSVVEQACAESLVSIGETSVFEQQASNWRTRILRHKETLRAEGGASANEDASFEHDKAVAHHDVAEKKAVEEQMLRRIESEFAESIGGVMQRLELMMDGDEICAAFSQDDRPFRAGNSFTLASEGPLVPTPTVEQAGLYRGKR